MCYLSESRIKPMTMRIFVIAIILCTLFSAGCTSEKPDYDVGIAAYERGHYQAAMYDFETRAMRGDPVAQFCLGFMYKHGKGVPANDKKAEEWYTKAAEQGYVPAQNNLSIIYVHKAEKEEDSKIAMNYHETALQWLKELIVEQSSIGLYNSALVLYFKAAIVSELGGHEADVLEVYEGVVDFYTRAARKGYVPAQNNLGQMYEEGKGVDESLTETERWKEAVKWYTEAAEPNPDAVDPYKKGHAIAQFNLALMYWKGKGVDESLTETERWKEAVKWYTKAAEQNNAPAQNNLAIKYERGKGVDKNLEIAARWLLRSAQLGQPVAQENLGRMFEEGLKDENGEELIAKDNAEAYYWYSFASGNNPDAEMVKALERVGNQLDDERKNEVRERIQKWKPRTVVNSGTGFYIDEKHILTNAHVARRNSVNKYDELRVGYRYVEEKLGTAAVNSDVDLALLYDSNPFGNRDTFATFRSAPVEFGEDIVSFGYPISYLLSYRGNVTPGIVSGLSGMLTLPQPDNHFQHTAPIQGGNSGGPIFDRAGHVVGVTVSKLILHIEVGGYAPRTVEIGPPQNANFAIKFAVVEDFLRRNDITPTLSLEDLDSTINKEKISEEARKFTVPVLCFMNKQADPLPLKEFSIEYIANLERKNKQ